MPSESSDIYRWLSDIRYNIDLAQRFTVNLAYEDFCNDLLRLYAVTRCLEIISEASRRLPEAMKTRYPSIAWKEMAGAGNVYRHEYDGVAALYVWVTLHDHLPSLRDIIEYELAALKPPFNNS